jgi:hypothetical protein
MSARALSSIIERAMFAAAVNAFAKRSQARQVLFELGACNLVNS